MPAARGYHGLAVDDQGYIVGSDGSNLIRSDYQGNWSVFVPSMGTVQQMDYLPNGDLAVAANGGALMSVTSFGGQSIIVTDVFAYAVLVGPDGIVYTANSSQVYRVDPALNQRTVFTSMPGGETAHALNFSPDYAKMYIGVISGASSVYQLDLDANRNPIGIPYLLASNVGSGWHDGLAVDICGNLYVPEFWSRSLYRVTRFGQVQRYLDWSSNGSQYGHGAVFGNNIGGFRDDALYMPMPYGGNTVKELIIGVPSRFYQGPVINGP
jgi:sugar lactone lactonase YvrE